MKKIAYCLIGILITANLNAGIFGERAKLSASCGIKVVSYRFVGNAGTDLVYGSKAYTVPRSGEIELVAAKGVSTYQIGTKSFALPQDVRPNEFGSVTVALYKAAAF